MNFKDEEILNQSLGNLSDTLLRRRMMQQEQDRYQQQQAIEQQRYGNQQADREVQLDLERQRLDAEKGDYRSEADFRDAQAKKAAADAAATTTNADTKQSDLVNRLKKNTMDFHQKQIDEISKEVDQGVLTPEQGTKMIQTGAAKWDDWEKQENPMFAEYTSPDFKLQAKPKPPQVIGEDTTTDPNDPNVRHTKKIYGDPNAKPAPAPVIPTVSDAPAYQHNFGLLGGTITPTSPQLPIGNSSLPNMAPAQSPAPATSGIPPAAIKALQANPDKWKDFEAKFGSGTSSQYLP